MRSYLSKTLVLLFIIFLVGTVMVQAQDLFLFDLANDEGTFVLKNGRNITERKGYDNQPYFTSDSERILFSSLREGSMDIYEYDLKAGNIKQLTNTPDVPEYSPIPDIENKSFTVVADNKVPNQTVWRYNRETGNSEWALASHAPVGYYNFNERGEALVWVRYAHNIRYEVPKKKISKYVIGNAAPSRPLIVPGTDNFSFVHRQMNGEKWIKIFDPDDYSITLVAPVIEDNISYCWSADGILLMGNGSRLFQWNPDKNTEWEEVADLSKFNVNNITRMHVSPDNTKIVIVADDHLG